MKRRKEQFFLGLWFIGAVFLLTKVTADTRQGNDWNLHFYAKPQLLLNLNSASERQRIGVEQFDGKIYQMSIALQYMDADCGQGDNKPLVHIETSSDHQSVCKPVDDQYYVSHVWAGFQSANISTSGNWNNTVATLVASVYYEVTSCSECAVDEFCCGRFMDDCLDLPTPSNFLGQKHDTSGKEREWSPRCIPASLVCDSHPSCGKKCNADEFPIYCNNQTYPDECQINPAACFNWNLSFFWTAIMAVVFFVMAPTIIVFLICYHRQVNAMRARRAGGPVTVNSPENDRPPTYDELEPEEPPPCFCYATSIVTNETSADGVDNPTFQPDTNVPRKSFQCVCGNKSQSPTEVASS